MELLIIGRGVEPGDIFSIVALSNYWSNAIPDLLVFLFAPLKFQISIFFSKSILRTSILELSKNRYLSYEAVHRLFYTHFIQIFEVYSEYSHESLSNAIFELIIHPEGTPIVVEGCPPQQTGDVGHKPVGCGLISHSSFIQSNFVMRISAINTYFQSILFPC